MLPFLPALLGAGLQTGLGLTALQAGLATGLGTAVVTKDLSKGLTAGLGAFGGANLSSGLGQAGQATSAAQAGQQAVTTGMPASTATSYQAAGQAAGGAPIPNVVTGMQTQPITTTMQGSALQGADLTKQAATQYGNLGTSAERLASVQEGLGAIGRDPAALQAAGGAGSLTMSGLTALTPALETEMDYEMGDPSMIRPYSYDPETTAFTALEPYPVRSGGVIPGLASQVRMQQGGRFLSGQGDGMSDSIRANIDGTMEARLSDGEFVLPADVVSGLGNGSSDAGADRLYTMMDRVRKERTGTTKQAPEINARSTMPA
jgi:hypothetical protein